MRNYQEDEPPCIHHRSQFDTIPAPPMFGKPSEPTMRSVVAVGHDGEPIPPGTNQMADFHCDVARKVLSFAGGEVELPKPTRADLVLSAQQWATAIRESIRDEFNDDGSTWAKCARIMGNVNRLDAILKELAES